MRKLISEFVQEQKRYLKSELRSIFSFDNEEEVDRFIRRLMSYGILKKIAWSREQLDKTDLIDDEIEVSEDLDGEYLYVFKYVGILTYGTRTIKVYPKYIKTNDEPSEEMKLIIKVLEHYQNSSKQQINNFDTDGKTGYFNLLAIILFFLNDYYEYGIYDNIKKVIEINGDGDTLWDKTIDECYAVIRDNRPYYDEIFTQRNVYDDANYIRRLHELILTECSRHLEEAALTDLFDITSVDLSNDEIELFGDKEYILYKIERELATQYNTRKQILLKAMYAYVSETIGAVKDHEAVSMYGSSSFHTIWEAACSAVFDNMKDVRVGELSLVHPLDPSFLPNKKLCELIELPTWSKGAISKKAKKTFNPDILAIYREAGREHFAILDAKYYNLVLEISEPLSGNPGVEDIAKQYIYQLAYKDFITKQRFAKVHNCFIMPHDGMGIIDEGTANIMILENIGLEPIQVRKVSAKEIYEAYISSKTIPLSYLSI